MKLIFETGEKGLHARYEGKHYFPDRRSDINEEGVYECTVSKDKETYAFVTGTPIKTKLPSVEYMTNLYRSTLIFDKRDERWIEGFWFKVIGSSSVILIYEQNGFYNIGYISDDDTFVTIESVSTFRAYNTPFYYKPFATTDEMREIVIQALGKVTEHISEEDRFLVAANIYNNEKYQHKLTGITFYDTGVIISTQYYEFTGNYDIRSYCVIKDEDGNRHLVDMNVTPFYFLILQSYHIHGYIDRTTNVYQIENEDMLGEKLAIIKPAELRDWMVEHKVGTYIPGSLPWDEDFVDQNRAIAGVPLMRSRELSFLNQSIEVTYYMPDALLNQTPTEEESKKVEDSFKELEAFRKRVSKNVSKTTIKELKNLSTASALGADRLE